MAAKKVELWLLRVDCVSLSYGTPKLMTGAQLMARSNISAATIRNVSTKSSQHSCTYNGMADVLLIYRVDVVCPQGKPAGTVSPLLHPARSPGTAVLRGSMLGPTDRSPPSFRTGGL